MIFDVLPNFQHWGFQL